MRSHGTLRSLALFLLGCGCSADPNDPDESPDAGSGGRGGAAGEPAAGGGAGEGTGGAAAPGGDPAGGAVGGSAGGSGGAVGAGGAPADPVPCEDVGGSLMSPCTSRQQNVICDYSTHCDEGAANRTLTCDSETWYGDESACEPVDPFSMAGHCTPGAPRESVFTCPDDREGTYCSRSGCPEGSPDPYFDYFQCVEGAWVLIGQDGADCHPVE